MTSVGASTRDNITLPVSKMIFSQETLQNTEFRALFELAEALAKFFVFLPIIIGLFAKVDEFVHQRYLQKRLCTNCRAKEYDRCETQERAQGFNYYRLVAFEQDFQSLRDEYRSIKEDLQIIKANLPISDRNDEGNNTARAQHQQLRSPSDRNLLECQQA